MFGFWYSPCAAPVYASIVIAAMDIAGEMEIGIMEVMVMVMAEIVVVAEIKVFQDT